MPSILVSERAFADLQRITQFLRDQHPGAASQALDTIFDALTVLERHPAIGRPVVGVIRELVISFGDTGYVALYRIRPQGRRVEILAVRHQREAGYS